MPWHVPASLSDEDRAYLGNKGVFTLPGNETCYSLVRAYFCHVHPIMPIIEADYLLNAFHSGRLRDYNVLLLWSIFFVAVNVLLICRFLSHKCSRIEYFSQFIPSSIYEDESYESRKAMKAALYSCAKVGLSVCVASTHSAQDGFEAVGNSGTMVVPIGYMLFAS